MSAKSKAEPTTLSGALLMERLDTLAGFTEVPGEVTRTYLTPALKQAGEQIIAWMRAAGMNAGFDAVGNVVGRYEGQVPRSPALLLGSHYDSVRNAGRFDGPYGVIAAISVVAALNAAGRRLPFPIEVLAFGDEEGVRFNATLIGSRAVAGTLERSVFDIKDADGINMRDALAAFGGDAGKLASAKRSKARGYLELHIEQGPVLIAEKLPVAIVGSIAGASRFAITFDGQAGHAGTVPMTMRRDAAGAAAEFILAVEARGRSEPGLVATVGKLNVPNGAANVIPARCELSLDVRSGSDAVRRKAVKDLMAALKDIGKRRAVGVSVLKTHEAAAVMSDPGLKDALARSIERRGLRRIELMSGAGHDAMAMADLCPVAMLFVRCGNGGISHDPREIMTARDAEVGARVLYDTVVGLASAAG